MDSRILGESSQRMHRADQGLGRRCEPVVMLERAAPRCRSSQLEQLPSPERSHVVCHPPEGQAEPLGQKPRTCHLDRVELAQDRHPDWMGQRTP
jgi:hypothetical protein